MEHRLIEAMRNDEKTIQFFNDPKIDLFLERRSKGVYQLISEHFEYMMIVLNDSLWDRLQKLYEQCPSIFESAAYKHRIINVEPKVFDSLVVENLLDEEQPLFDEISSLYIKKSDMFLFRSSTNIFHHWELRQAIYREVETDPIWIEVRSLFQHPELYRDIFQHLLCQSVPIDNESVHPLIDLLNNLLKLREDFEDEFKRLVA